jgi:hypothetical protein
MFLAQKIEVLGHTIEKKGMMATSKNISGIENFKEPVFNRKMLIFLGYAGYARKYVPIIAIITHCSLE